MLNSEFSNEFDVLYNSITSNQAPGLDEYEKSVFLTNAQDDVLRAYFNPRENKPQQGFDDSKKRQIDFSALMKSLTLTPSMSGTKFDDRSIVYKMPGDLLLFVNEACKDKNYRYVVLPISYEEYDRLMLKPYQYPIKRGVWRLIVDSPVDFTVGKSKDNQYLIIKNSSPKDVVFKVITTGRAIPNLEDVNGNKTSITGVGKAPTFTETPTSVYIECVVSSTLESTSTYWNAFILPDNKPWSNKLHSYVGDMNGSSESSFPSISASEIPAEGISVSADSVTPSIELIGRLDKDSLSYTVRYLRKPRPIILPEEGFEEGLSIQGISTYSTCELDESLHQEILQRAVELAKAAYLGDLQSQIALGQTSKTDIGMVQSNR